MPVLHRDELNATRKNRFSIPLDNSQSSCGRRHPQLSNFLAHCIYAPEWLDLDHGNNEPKESIK